LVLVALTFIVTGAAEFTVSGATWLTMGAAGGLIVTFTVAGADGPAPFVAVTWKVSCVALATSGAVKVTLAAVPLAGVKVTAGVPIWTHWNVMGVGPVAAALKVTVEFETAGLGLAVADVITGTLLGLIVTFTVAGAEVPAAFVAVTEKVSVVFTATDGAENETTEPSAGGFTVVRVTVGPSVWVQLNVIGNVPLAAAVKVTAVPKVAVVGLATTDVTIGAVGVTVTLTGRLVPDPPALVAVTVKVAVSVAVTVGAVQVMLAASAVEGVKVPGVPAVWLQRNVMVPAPVATADRFTVPPEVMVVGLALAVTLGACTVQLDDGTGTVGNGLS
jgi:hypothetical protein